MKIANNRVTTEDVGQQEKKLNFKMPAQVLAPESKSTSIPMATAALASINGAPCHSLMPVWNSLKPQMELTSSTAARSAELLLKNEKEETLGTLPVAMTHPTVLRQVKFEATLGLSTTDSLEPRLLEQKRLEEKWQRDLLNVEKRDSTILCDATGKQGKERSILPHGMLVQDGSWIDPQESNFSKSKTPKVEKKLEIPISESNDKSQKTKDVPDALEIDLRPEHMYGDHTLPESALLHKPSPTAPNQALAEQIHRQGNTLGSRLVLPMTRVAMTDGGRDRAHTKRQRAKDRISRDVLAMEDISSHKVPVNSVIACVASDRKIVKLPHYRTLKSCLVPSEKHHHRRERAEHYRLCDEKERLQDELPATPNFTGHANAPLKLKIQIPSASSSVVSPSKCPPDLGELKMKIKVPVVGQTRPEVEAINGFKLKISLKGPSGKVESVATGDRHSFTHDDTLLQTAARINNGGTSSHGVKLVLSKDKISGGYQHGVLSHHEEQRQHLRRRRRHSKQPGTEHNGLSGKRCASHPLLGFQKLKILRLGSEIDCDSNGPSNYCNSVICSGLYSQHPGFSASVQETAFSHSMLSKPCQMLPVAGLVQPSLPPPLPGESAPPPLPLPPCCCTVSILNQHGGREEFRVFGLL